MIYLRILRRKSIVNTVKYFDFREKNHSVKRLSEDLSNNDIHINFYRQNLTKILV